MSIIIPANSAAGGGVYEVDNSARFQTASLKRSAGSKTNATKATISMWFKRSELADCVLMQSYVDDSNRSYIRILGDIFYFFDRSGGTTNNYWTSTFVLRDVSAWYHLHVNIDTGNGTAANRFIVHLNGVNQPVANFTNNASYGSGVTSNWQVASGTNQFTIGANESVSDVYFGGYMSEVVYLDGQVVAYDSFGEFDEDSGIWKPISVSGLTPGNTGFYLDFEDSSDLGADVIGSNDFTATGLAAIDQTTDTPTNNFCTLNPLNVPASNQPTFSEGNLQSISISGAGSFGGSSTFTVSSGKWYLECKALNSTSSVGISYNAGETARTNNDATSSYEWNYKYNGTLGHVTDSSYGDSFTTNDIIGIALNLDDNELIFYKNGTAQDSGTPISITASQEYVIYHQDDTESGSNQSNFAFNFGSPPYAISSGNTDGNGYGNFEYAVPSGFLSLCTANLSEVLG